MATRMLHQGKSLPSREHSRLKYTKEESRGQQTAVVLDKSLHDCYEAKKEHIQTEPDVRLELFEQDITGDLEMHKF